jgi:hypothetical protein
MLSRKSKTQFVNQERNTQNTIALLKRIASQQLMLTKVSQNFFQAKRTQAQLFKL